MEDIALLPPYYRQLAQRAINCIDTLLSGQINVIIHHKRFQQLEASWRGLSYLVDQIAERNDRHLKVKVFTISWHELGKDLVRAVEFDQSQLFTKIYSTEFGQSGGEPFGLLIGDYYLSHRNNVNNIANDITVLQCIAKVAAAAFVPFITSASATLFGLDDYTEFDRPLDLAKTFQQAEYAQWKALRMDEDARFIGLVLPQILLRLPYIHSQAIHYQLYFTEDVTTSHRHYLWGNAAYSFAAIVTRAFSKSGWFTDIRGKYADTESGGIVSNLIKQVFTTDAPAIASKPSTNICITDRQEKILSDFGFITLTHNQYIGFATFYACPSIQKPKSYDRKNPKQNANLSSMLHYILCVSRFAHYLKVMVRDKIGSFASAAECENYLQSWLHQYTASSADLSDELKAKYPLREAQVQVHESIGSPGKYLCTIHLCPHYQFDQIEAYLQLTAELS